ncbi:hypothetical protein RUM44_009020 [Polyplax serrata]|uniref:Leucine-rich repeat-containing protein 23 n=1 Tax=Polyplax serrata TaxID=468196 RepID=A0ABR1ARH5_POLSC
MGDTEQQYQEYDPKGDETGSLAAPQEDPEEFNEFIQSTTMLLLEKAIPDKPKKLTLKKAGECLGLLGKIWNLSEYPPLNQPDQNICNNDERLMDMEGYVDEYQYLHLQAVDMNLTDVRVLPKYFVWLLSVDLSGNLLTNEMACPVTRLPNIVALRLNRNKFRDPYLPVMKHLQYLGLNSNKITSLHRIYHPNLETLDLNYNRIPQICGRDSWKLTKLTQLELRGNLLQSTLGIEYANLVNLYLAQNQITELKGIETLVNLQRCHLRENPLSNLSGFSSSNFNLKYLNIRKCHIKAVEDVKPLTVLPALRELIIKGNIFNPEPENGLPGEPEAFEDNKEYENEETDSRREPEQEDDEELRIQLLLYLPQLKRIDKKLVTKHELESMKEMKNEMGTE